MNLATLSRSCRLAAVLAVASLLLGSAGIACLAQETAALLGTVFDLDGRPAAGFVVVFRDVASGKEVRSGASNVAGLYETTVPVGGRYKLQSVVAPDGTMLPVQDVAPIAIQVPGFNRLDVRFLSAASGQPPAKPPVASGAAVPAAAPTVKAEKKRRGVVPWWKTPGGIVGIVVGVGAVAAIAAGGGGDGGSDSPSPSTPAN